MLRSLTLMTGGVGPNLPLEQQVLRITKSTDMLKLRALEKLCSPEFYDDPSLLTAVDKRILELLLLRLGEQKTTGPKVVKKLAVLEGYEALGMACGAPNNNCGRASSYMTQAKDGYE
ncbi:hypothetical protein TrLO_g8206 [Triparma laevis f. longispina]|uniref:Uncharacterized protein n=1 Tax=Triparma laevis f. longispina TaxID=1714387 RepID=A0A9W6ZBM9_9STRA|nr:hypothetical protein TrLO_g8206 [Triparma laevis f. longispina]